MFPGEPTAIQKEMFTRVLKGHIGVDSRIFVQVGGLGPPPLPLTQIHSPSFSYTLHDMTIVHFPASFITL